eukprot:5383777-Amphidinium_carterae.1
MVRARALTVYEQGRNSAVNSVEKKLAKDLKEAVGILRMHEQSRAPCLEFLHANEWKLDVEPV